MISGAGFYLENAGVDKYSVKKVDFVVRSLDLEKKYDRIQRGLFKV